MLLSAESPWFLVTYRAQGPDLFSMIQTIAVAWEKTVIELIDGLGRDCILGIRVLVPQRPGAGQWLMKAIRELWLPSPDDEGETGPLLFAIDESGVLYDASFTNGLPVRAGRERVLLLSTV